MEEWGRIVVSSTVNNPAIPHFIANDGTVSTSTITST
jgi:hypothetical protein